MPTLHQHVVGVFEGAGLIQPLVRGKEARHVRMGQLLLVVEYLDEGIAFSGRFR